MSGKVQYSDSEILDAIRRGQDNKVLDSLYKNVLPTITNFICSNSGNEDEAYDVFQDAVALFYRLVINEEFNEKYKIAGFLYTVSKNYWINRAKKLKRQTQFGDIGIHEKVEDNALNDIMDVEKRKAVMELFSRMGEKCLKLLTFSVLHKMSMDEICLELGYPNANAAKTQNYRCKKLMVEEAKKSKYFTDLLLS